MDTLLFETSYWNVFLAKDQTYFGRSVVVLKRACGSLAEITREEAMDFLEVVRKYEVMFKKEYRATPFNYTCLMNDAYQNNPPDPQVHWHFRPRYNHPVIFQGVEFVDPNFGHHYERRPVRELEKELEQKLVSELKLKFQS